MKNRKRIGVIGCDIVDEFHKTTLKGISECAHTYDFDVLIFTTFMVGHTENQYQIGEMNIYNLINFSLLDGIVFIEDCFKNPVLVDEIFELLAKKCSLPVAVIGDGRGIYPSSHFNGRSAIEDLTDHFIEIHNFRKIYCLTGHAYESEAVERLEGYHDSMKKHSIDVPESYVFFGDFWQISAEKLAQDIADGIVERPEAVVCANDSMAIFLTNKLNDLGINVPSEIAVCGFDHIPESGRNVPSITTYFPPDYDTGEKAALYVIGKITSTDLLSDYIGKSGFIDIRKSCGCSEDQNKLLREYRKAAESRHFSDLFNTSFMEEALYTAHELNEFEKRLCNFTYLVDGIYRYHLCLCSDWSDDITDSSYRTNGYAEKMLVGVTKYEDYHVDLNTEFLSSDMVPSLFEDRDFAVSYFLTPLHFNDRCFGYSVVSYGKNAKVFDNIYRLWNKNIDTALELIRVRNQIYLSSVTDSLTGLYNRRGFDEKSLELFNNAVENGDDIFIVGADVDNLKYINDNFGHIEGDRAITTCAYILKSSCRNNEICSRSGGDEFTVMGTGKYAETDFIDFKNRVNKYTEQFNSFSEMPYKIGISIGGYVGQPQPEMPLERLITSVDNEMYKDKCARKGGRRRDDIKAI